jgi:chloramphenicol O-acetyltransferase
LQPSFGGGETYKDGSRMHLKSNGGAMVVTFEAEIPGYHKTVWFSKRAITNIIALRNLIQQCLVTYDTDDLMFVVHHESENKLHLVNTVSEKKEDFTKRQIEDAETA